MPGKVVAVCVSDKKQTQKAPVAQVHLKPDWGIKGDAHAGKWHRQVSLLGQESIDRMKAQGLGVAPGAFAENITTSGMDLPSLPVGTRLRLGETLVEVTQIGKVCHAKCAVYAMVGDCVMPREGIFVKVLEEGVVKPGDTIEEVD